MAVSHAVEGHSDRGHTGHWGGAKVGKHIERYLSKSYGFIFVVNSANAGGVQQGRHSVYGRSIGEITHCEEFSKRFSLLPHIKVAGDAINRIANKLAREIGTWERDPNS
ncbi:hypothetical protein DPMN_016690 [Dreissena polymorpha]|uniref:Uncharacterized protein n=1 Tax=Dreissena polymorpha TaxID=45954 RepID=A0A9D4NDZ0_DREPO|nr:hypothetical protein DPMN_016690 [Dreissena polymorpha]